MKIKFSIFNKTDFGKYTNIKLNIKTQYLIYEDGCLIIDNENKIPRLKKL